ncbi:isoaspartyl peptidase/L-asparaginase family protein [Xanthocytophaga flava]|uniref:isoaspartyl peptidase/L-asparaginase family protein n=1 Tax=Xanthocytophaga flava TaxID=3048013 RepID=UPI0028D43378|nr:isoaspartyl peptidase/L-asparaginase [Xanthocytophaga flavus]MDJ1469571.1 isoaspartyl peptidase/L-asparaginase [Xanthocytophaga flavus]
MSIVALAIHGGAEPLSPRIKQNQQAYEAGLHQALEAGYRILRQGGSAVDAVEAAIQQMELHPLFNAGRGAALDQKGEVAMDASIMNGKDLQAGAVALVRQIQHPISLARAVMEQTPHVLMGAEGAMELGRSLQMPFMPDSYFISESQYNALAEMQMQTQNKPDVILNDTVGAVALDQEGNLAAGTSTGGLTNQMKGRIGDSCMIGAGCYANNITCAVSGTGDGECLMRKVAGYSVSALMEFAGKELQEACDFVVFKKDKHVLGDIGLISMDACGKVVFSFNTECMFRGWISSDLDFTQVAITK